MDDVGSLPRGVYRKGLRIQMRVIGALILRELHTRYGRENIGYIWLFLEPFMLATMIALIHSRSGSHFGADIKPVPLSIVGYCNFITFRGIFNRGEGALEANLPLFYHRTISVFDVLLARALLEAAGTWTSFAVIMCLAISLGIASPPERPLILLGGMVMMLWLSFSLSMVICAITHDNHGIGRLVHPFSYIMMPLSGAFFPLNSLPPNFRDVILYIPLAHIFEVLRYGWFKTAHSEYIDPYYLGYWLLGSTLLGLLLLSQVRTRIQMA